MAKKLKIAVCFFGHLRTFKKCAPKLKENMLSKYDCDIFMHTWDKLNHSTPTWHANEFQTDDTNVKDIICSYGKLKAIEVEQQTPQDWGCANFLVNYNMSQTSISIYGMSAMFYSMAKVNQLRSNYEKKNKIKYDYVVCLRPDILLNRELDINNLLSTQAPEDIDKALFTMANPFATVLKGFESYGITDCFFLGRPNVVENVLSNLPKVKEVFQPNVVYRNGPEYEFIKAIKALNYIPYRIDFKYGEDIDILRNQPSEKLRKKIIRFHLFKKKCFVFWLFPKLIPHILDIQCNIFNIKVDISLGNPKRKL